MSAEAADFGKRKLANQWKITDGVPRFAGLERGTFIFVIVLMCLAVDIMTGIVLSHKAVHVACIVK